MKRVIAIFIYIIAASLIGHAQMRPDNLPPLLGPPEAIARMNVTHLGGPPPAGGSCDDCSGSLGFSAHFENNDDITQGTPCGCSDGDYTLSKTGVTFSSTQYYGDGGYSLYNAGTAAHYATVDISSDDIASEVEGKVTFYLYLTENFDSEYVPYIISIASATDYVRVQGEPYATGNDLRLRIKDADAYEYSAIADTNLSLNTWYLVTAQWNLNATGGTKLSLNANSVTGTDAAAFAAEWPSGPTQVRLAETTHADAGAFYIDQVKIYSESDLE